MTTGARTRNLIIGALAAAVWYGGGGTAVAGPPAGHGPTRTTTGYAGAVLTGTQTPDLTVFFDAFAPEGTEPFGRLEVFVAGYECLTEEAVPASIDGLDSAMATGELPIVCGSPEGEATGSATVDLVWAGEGPVRRYVIAGPGFPCRSLGREREADVTGSVQVVIPGLGIEEVTTPDDDNGRLTSVRSICPRGTA